MQDGSIQYEVKLTGCLSTSILSEGEGMDPTHGTLIGPHLNAQLHQHYFCVRLDMAVDDPDGGAALTVSEVSHHPHPLVRNAMFSDFSLLCIHKVLAYA